MLDKLLRLGEGRMVKRLKRVADYVNTLSDDVEKLSDAELRAKTEEFRKRYADGEDLDDLMPEAFAVAREAAWRVLDQRPYDVQIMGGAALHFGNVAEMKTGEGKTLTCVLPAYLNALSGKGVHVVTVNDYLAKRDSEWMGRVHRFLGLEVGVILAQMTPDQRRVGLQRGHHLRHQQRVRLRLPARQHGAYDRRDGAARAHPFAIVDEVDSILIDEARTPLIISGPADGSSNWYSEFARLAPLMEKDKHYEVDLRKRTIGVSELGVEFVEDQLGIDNLYEAANSPLVSYLNNAIKAKELFMRDKDYIVRDGEVADRRRVHRPRAPRAPLQRGHAPGHRGQGKRRDQGREPDAGHHHAAELLPPLRQARRDDRHRADRGRRAARDLQARRRAASRPTSRWSAPTSPT